MIRIWVFGAVLLLGLSVNQNSALGQSDPGGQQSVPVKNKAKRKKQKPRPQPAGKPAEKKAQAPKEPIPKTPATPFIPANP